MWNYIYYYVYVSRIDPRDRSAIQKYVHDKVITSANPSFSGAEKKGTLTYYGHALYVNCNT